MTNMYEIKGKKSNEGNRASDREAGIFIDSESSRSSLIEHSSNKKSDHAIISFLDSHFHVRDSILQFRLQSLHGHGRLGPEIRHHPSCMVRESPCSNVIRRATSKKSPTSLTKASRNFNCSKSVLANFVDHA